MARVPSLINPSQSEHGSLTSGSPQPAAPLSSFRPPQPQAPQQPQAPRGMGLALPGRPGQGERALIRIGADATVQSQRGVTGFPKDETRVNVGGKEMHSLSKGLVMGAWPLTTLGCYAGGRSSRTAGRSVGRSIAQGRAAEAAAASQQKPAAPEEAAGGTSTVPQGLGSMGLPRPGSTTAASSSRAAAPPAVPQPRIEEMQPPRSGECL